MVAVSGGMNEHASLVYPAVYLERKGRRVVKDVFHRRRSVLHARPPQRR
jgi:hypothetical protein